LKKLILIPALLTASLALAKPYTYEISPMIGYNIAEGNIGMKENGYPVYGVELQYNKKDWFLSPELFVIYTDSGNAEYDASAKETDILRAGVNGVKIYNENGIFQPFAKAGLGMEKMDYLEEGNKNSLFVDAGAGVKIPLMDHLALKLEAIYMLKENDNRWDNNAIVQAGLTFGFGAQAEKKAPVAAVVAPVVIDGDDDNDGVLNSKDICPNTAVGVKVGERGCFLDGDDDNDGVLNTVDKCPTTAANTKVDAEGCKLDGDDDNDGVLNSKDICPNTPLGEAVNEDGCSKIITLHVTFPNDSSKIETSSYNVVQKYADFLNKYTAYSAKIVGHTDSRGSAAYNQKLSERRANSIKDMLIEKGVPASRVSAAGEGETKPMADNATAEGRAQNRRIEAELTKN